MKVRKLGYLLGVLYSLGCAGCMSLKEEVAQQESLVLAGDYSSAYDNASTLARDGGVESADSNFWNTDAGTLALMSGDLPSAIEHLDIADNGFNDEGRRLLGKGARDTTLAIATNDCIMPYAPEGVNRVFVNLYKALAYGGVGNPDLMRMELNRVRQRQNEWFYICTKDIAEQEESLNSMKQKERESALKTLKTEKQVVTNRLDATTAMQATNDLDQSAARFFTRLQGFGNAYASHVTGVVRWCAGDTPRNDFAMAAALAPTNRFVRADFNEERQASTSPTGRVWVYVEDGLAPKRVSSPKTLPYFSIMSGGKSISTISFDVPRLKERAAAAQSYTVNSISLERLVDVDALVEDQFNREWYGILARQIARTVSRVVAQEATQAAIKSSVDDGGLTALLAGLLFSAYDVSMNAADIRCADLLPKRVWMASLPRPQNGKLTITPTGQASINVTLPTKGNALVWIRKPSTMATASVLVIDLDKR